MPTLAAFMSGKVFAAAPPCGGEEHQLCRPGHRPLAGVEVFSKRGRLDVRILARGRTGQPIEKHAVVSVAPPPSPLHQNPTRSHPSSRRCHGAFVAARQVAQIKHPQKYASLVVGGASARRSSVC